jgi:adenylosuccinate synthase
MKESNKGKVIVVLDAQAGSCGKGKMVGYIATHQKIALAINNFMSNAGHTFVYDSGEKVMTQHLPTSIVNPDTVLCIGPGSAITPSIILEEIFKYKDIIGDRQIYIHPRAMIILPQHVEKEQALVKSGSTFKGCGTAQADKVMRVPGTVLAKEWLEEAHYQMATDTEMGNMVNGQVKWALGKITIYDTATMVNHVIDDGGTVLVEGSQGFDLDINYGLDYPHTTSRQCHAGQLLADCGISPTLVTDIIMTMRPYPIRISNTTNLTDSNGQAIKISSGDYDGSPEITWEEVRERCGAPEGIEFGEQTTVTKKTRRVFELNMDRLKYAVLINRPTQIALNFAQYIDWEMNGSDEITDKLNKFMAEIESATGVPITMIGTGARNSELIK